MAFTGTATVEKVSDSIVRITGLSLASGAAGTISLSGGTGAVKAPHAFKPNTYVADGAQVSLQASIDVTCKPATAVTTSIPVEVVKSGTTPADWLVTLTNNHGSLASPGLEIYLKYHQ